MGKRSLPPERAQEILQCIGEGVICQEADGRITFWNQAAERVFGLSAEEAVGLTSSSHDWRLIHEDGSPCPGPEHPSMLTLGTGQALSGQIRGVARPGQPVAWLSINTRPLFRPGETAPHAVVISFNDVTERKMSQEALAASEEKFAKAFQSAPLLMTISDLEDGAIVEANEMFCQVSGYSLPEVLGRSSLDLGWQTEEERRAWLERLHEKEWSESREVALRAKDGRAFHCLVNQRAVTLGGRRMLINVAQDITERKETEERLRASEDVNRVLMESSAVPMAISDLHGRWLLTNPAFCQALGHTAEELAGRSNLEVTHPEDREATRERLRAMIEGRLATCRMEKRYLCKDGSIRWMDVSLSPLHDEQGHSHAFLGICSDVTQRKLAEEELRRSEEKYRQLVKHAPAGIYEIDLTSGRFLSVNDLMCQYTGYSREEFLALEPMRLLTEESGALFRERQMKVASGQEVPPTVEFQFRTKTGELFWTLLNVRMQRLSAGQMVASVVAHDISARKKAEEALRASEEKFAKLFRHGPLLMTISALDDGALLDANEAFYKASGYSPRETQGKTSVELGWITPIQREALMDKLLTQGWIRHEEITARAKGGRPIHLLISAEIIALPERRVVAVSAVDITRRKLAEEALRQSGEVYRTLVASLPDIVMRFDRDGRHLFVSENVSQVTDLQPAAFIVKTHRELGFPEEQCRMWEEAIRQVYDSGQPYETEFSYQGKSGRVIFNWRLVPERDPQGQVRSVLSISRDITAHRRMEEDYRILFHKMLDGFALHEIICDEAGTPVDYRFLAVNPAFERHTGAKAEDLVGRTVLEALPDTEKHWIETYGRVALTGEPLIFESYSGALDKHFEVSAFRPAPGQFACIFTDITERIRIGEEKDKLENQLRQAQKMEAIGTLAGGIAHDFNNILGAVLGFAEMAHEDALIGQTDPHDLEQIILSAQRAKELVKQILTFSRKNEPSLQPLSMNMVARRVREILERTLPKMISIQLNLNEGLPHVQADPTQVEQVLLNLAANAADAMPEGGRLTLATRRATVDDDMRRLHLEMKPGEYAMLTVSDTGQGMSQEVREHIFEPFFTTKEVGRGTGLGLSTVYGIVKSHGGYIYCQSHPDQGSTFEIYLPVPSEAAEPVQAEEGLDMADLIGDEVILLADDEAALREVAARHLRAGGYQVVTVTSGEEAVQQWDASETPPDLVLMDLGMPGMGGHKAMLEILARHPQAKVVIASGYAAHNQVRASLEAGAVGYVAKPFHRLDLLASIRQALDRREN